MLQVMLAVSLLSARAGERPPRRVCLCAELRELAIPNARRAFDQEWRQGCSAAQGAHGLIAALSDGAGRD